MTQSLCSGVAVRGWDTGSVVGEGSLPGGYTGGGAAGGMPVGVGGCGVETVFFFLPFFLIPLLFVLLGDLESLLEDEDSRCGELEDIL